MLLISLKTKLRLTQNVKDSNTVIRNKATILFQGGIQLPSRFQIFARAFTSWQNFQKILMEKSRPILQVVSDPIRCMKT